MLGVVVGSTVRMLRVEEDGIKLLRPYGQPSPSKEEEEEEDEEEEEEEAKYKAEKVELFAL